MGNRFPTSEFPIPNSEFEDLGFMFDCSTFLTGTRLRSKGCQHLRQARGHFVKTCLAVEIAKTGSQLQLRIRLVQRTSRKRKEPSKLIRCSTPIALSNVGRDGNSCATKLILQGVFLGCGKTERYLVDFLYKNHCKLPHIQVPIAFHRHSRATPVSEF